MGIKREVEKLGKGHILIIEDDKSIVKFLGIELRTSGYSFDITSQGQNGLIIFKKKCPDVILLDLGLPDIDGLEVIKAVRAESAVPIIVISAREEDSDKVEALDLGANDYVTKPFSTNELLARIRAVMRIRIPNGSVNKVYECRDLRIDFEKRQIWVEEKNVHLTPIEYKILVLLIENAGKVLTHKFIQNEIWGYSEYGEQQSLRVFVANIRRKIEKDTSDPEYIITEVGVGYRFVE